MGPIDSEQVFLKWNNFENNLASGFVDLLQQEAMVDVTLAVEGRLVQAHKVVLSICSSYFRNMFQVNPCQHPIVILKDVGYQELTDMLDFMYRGEANVKQQDLPSFLKLAETLKVKGLASGSSESPTDRHQTDQDNRRESSVLNTKHCSAGDVKDGIRDVNNPKKSFPILRKKRKRSLSPMKTNDMKVNLRTNKHENMDASDEDKKRKYSPMNDIECVNIKEERLSDVSCDSYGDEVGENEFQIGSDPGPSRLDESSENIRKGDEIRENDLPGNRLFPGPSRADELGETVPQELVISRRASKPLSLIWSFFNFDCHENKSECKLCGKVFKACPKTGTASVKYHLHFAHQILRNDGAVNHAGDFRFIKSGFGGNFLLCKGYTYRKKSKKGEKVYFVCTVKRCHGRGILFGGVFRLTNSQHSHKARPPDNFEEKEILKKLKKLALESNEPGPALLKVMKIERNRERYLKAIRSWRSRERKKASKKQLMSFDRPAQAESKKPEEPTHIGSAEIVNVKEESEWEIILT